MRLLYRGVLLIHGWMLLLLPLLILVRVLCRLRRFMVWNRAWVEPHGVPQDACYQADDSCKDPKVQDGINNLQEVALVAVPEPNGAFQLDRQDKGTA